MIAMTKSESVKVTLEEEKGGSEAMVIEGSQSNGKNGGGLKREESVSVQSPQIKSSY